MAGSAEQNKRAIVAELAAARARLSATGEALRHALDMPARARESFKRHRPTWLTGATIVGFVLSKIPARNKTLIVERVTGTVLGASGKWGALLSTAKLAANFASPVISGLAESGLAAIRKRFHRPPKPAQPDDPPRL